MTGPVRFRPHHFLCAIGYQGKGYSTAFTANMDDIVSALRGADGADTTIEVTYHADAVCAPCPHRRGVSCAHLAKISALDARHAQALGLADGARLTWGEALGRIRENVAPGALGTLCAGCQWLELGLCEAALHELHRAE